MSNDYQKKITWHLIYDILWLYTLIMNICGLELDALKETSEAGIIAVFQSCRL